MCSLTSEDGSVAERYEYDAYGEPRVFGGVNGGGVSEGFAPLAVSRVGNPYMHQGLRRDDESGLHENRYRMLHSRLGRFMQRDPAGYVDGLNRNAYLRCAPTQRVDASGLQSLARPNGTSGVGGNSGSALDDAALGAIEIALKAGCFAQCFVLGLTNEDILETLAELQKNAPAELSLWIQQILQSAPGKASEALLALVSALRGNVRLLQGLGFHGECFKWLLGDLGIGIRKAIAKLTLRFVGKGGAKVLGRLGSKLIPVVGWVFFGVEVVEAARCVAACYDGVYTRDESWEGAGTPPVKSPNTSGGCGFRGTGPSCFATGTIVLTASGAAPIEEVAVGDCVMGWDGSSQQLEACSVRGVLVARASQVVCVTTPGGVIRVTGEHPFLLSSGEWIPAKLLNGGDRLVDSNGRPVEVMSVRLDLSPCEVRTLEVTFPHSFVVGADRVVVHNKILH